ncbi:MAG: pyruvate kinase [Chloroflexi bacterium]|nr:pyruvate kinase [Chloroflexota bacterium]MCL5076444.1 pyruvate kinase [Chloroflexota bacterium]
MLSFKQRTKIVCTIGPSSQSEDVLRQLIRSGMDVARLNFSHGDLATHARNITLIRRLAGEEGRIVAILQDLQGPRLRTGDLQQPLVVLDNGAEFTLTTRPVPGDATAVQVAAPHLPKHVKTGDTILIDDGQLELKVIETTNTDIRCSVVNGGPLGPHKGINLPDVSLSIPALTDKDCQDVRFGVEQGVDYIALSFVRSASDIAQLRDHLSTLGADIPIVAKIEKHEAIRNFKEILAAADAVMVARGDLGVETAPEEVPLLQKMIIRECNQAGKPVITATQMLSSMTEQPRPTRAEASDVANAILDGTDAVMLSAETALGKFPILAVQMMATIATKTEEVFPFAERLKMVGDTVAETVTDAISQATVEIAAELGAKAIITMTESGYTARMVARNRPKTPIIAVTPNLHTQRRLALVWGVEPLTVTQFEATDLLIRNAVVAAVSEGLVAEGDLTVITAGVPLGGMGRTNLLKVHVIGEESAYSH